MQNIANANLWPVLAAESLKALLGLGIISLGGRLFLRRIFEVCVLILYTEWSHFMIDEILRANYSMCSAIFDDKVFSCK